MAASPSRLSRRGQAGASPTVGAVHPKTPAHSPPEHPHMGARISYAQVHTRACEVRARAAYGFAWPGTRPRFVTDLPWRDRRAGGIGCCRYRNCAVRCRCLPGPMDLLKGCDGYVLSGPGSCRWAERGAGAGHEFVVKHTSFVKVPLARRLFLSEKVRSFIRWAGLFAPSGCIYLTRYIRRNALSCTVGGRYLPTPAPAAPSRQIA